MVSSKSERNGEAPVDSSSARAKSWQRHSERHPRPNIKKDFLNSLKFVSPIHCLAITLIWQRLRGPVGIFVTSHPIDETVEWFESWRKPEYARMGAAASRDITLPEGM